MTDAHLNRKLAAILAADVCGYSRLMAADDRGTVTALDAARIVFRAAIESNRGRVIDMAGDSVLACFDTALGAVTAAVAVQRALHEVSHGEAEDRRMRFRVGIHLGDVIQKADGTVYGDGVNIAARLESLAEPGGISVSDSIRMAVRGKIEAAFEDRGEHLVKNIPDPVRMYRVTWDGAPPARATVAAQPRVAPLSVPDRPSIAVLPFSNMSGDTEQEFFADGITEDIITELSRISGLLVIARNSTFVFKKQAVDIQEIGRRFGVRHVLEGSVRKAGARVRITAQLIESATSGHVWAEKYDRGLEDIFAVQDEVTKSIVSQLHVKLTAAERTNLSHRGKVNIEAYDLTMRARSHHLKFTPIDAATARALLDRAVQLDPEFGRPHAIRAMVHAAEYINGWVDTEVHVELGLEHARRAVELDPDDADGHCALAMLSLWQRNYDAAVRHSRTALEIAPGLSLGFQCLGQVLDFSGRHMEAIDAFEQALRTDPTNDMLVHLIGRAQFGAGRTNEAAEMFRRRIEISPRTDMSRVYLAAIYGAEARTDEARALWGEILAIHPRFSIERIKRVLPYSDPTWFERLAGGLRRAELISAT